MNSKISSVFPALAASLLSAFCAHGAESGVRYRGIFVNDEDWSLRPWAVRHFGRDEQIGVRAYTEIFGLMQRHGLNLLWPAMHEGGYEFSARPENMELAKQWGITIGTTHCEPLLRNNCYLPKADKRKWSWKSNREFLEEYWREGVRRGAGFDVLWTIGMRGIHDAPLNDGKTVEERKATLEEIFAWQKQALGPDAPTLFVPYKEVLPIYNAGLKVPEGTTIMWVNDNYGYVRRLGGPQCASYPQGLYWHLSYWGFPHGYLHLCTTPPAFMWYELAAKAWNNGVRDVWMVNVGDVFQAELLIDAYGRIAANPDAWDAGAQDKLLALAVADKLQLADGKLVQRIVAHLTEYFTLGFIRKPEFMCTHWTSNLPDSVKDDLLRRYRRLLAEDLAIDAALAEPVKSAYFRIAGFQAQFLAHAGIIHLESRSREYARSVLDPLHERWDRMDGGKWSGFWFDTIDEFGVKPDRKWSNTWMSHLQ